MDQGDGNLNVFLKYLSKPEDLAAALLSKDRNKHIDESPESILIDTCKKLFERIEVLGGVYSSEIESKNHESNPLVLSGLETLYIGGSENSNSDDDDNNAAESEILWGQVDLQNEALLSLVKKSVKKLSKVATGKSNNSTSGSNEIRLIEDIPDTDDESESINNMENEEESEDDGSHEDESVDSVAERIKSRMERVSAEMEDDDSSESDDSRSEEGSSNELGKKPLNEPEDEYSVLDTAAEELNDGFFSIKEMEDFADEEEEYLPEEAYGPIQPEENHDGDKRTFHQKQRDGDLDHGRESEDDESDEEDANLLFRNENTVRRRRYRQDDEIEALLGIYGKPSRSEKPRDDDSIDDVINMTAADIFGNPNKNRLESWKNKGRNPTKHSLRKQNRLSWNDGDSDSAEEEGEPGWNDYGENNDDDDEKTNDIEYAGSKQLSYLDNEMDEDVPMKGAEKEEKDQMAPPKQLEKLRHQTEQLEKEMLAEKPWHMIGEAASSARPVNSLLDSTPEFEIASKMAPIITVEHTMDLEEIIKKRILNEDWDDIIPRELPDVAWHKKKGELPEVSQEKSKLGLGELYEREYLKKVAGYDLDKAERETEEEKAKSEMRTLFANLCSKLDALSNYHFAPRPIADEAEIRPVTQPAIAMEEILPLHVSNARGVAPEEVYGAKRGRDGVLRADSELDQETRKRLRRSKKAARRKNRKEKLADDKLISRLQPGLGLNNPYEKRKAREELSMARAGGKIVTGKEDTTGFDYGASGTFFQRMQAEAEQSIKGQQNLMADPSNEKRSSAKSSALKL